MRSSFARAIFALRNFAAAWRRHETASSPKIPRGACAEDQEVNERWGRFLGVPVEGGEDDEP